MKPIAFCTFFMLQWFVNTQLNAQNQILGHFWTPEKDGKMEIFKKQDGKFYGRFTWVKDDTKDIHNPNPALRDKMVSEVEFLYGFKYNGKDAWEEGKIYDPNDGKTYSCTIKVDPKNNLLVRGYIGISLFGRTETFERIK